MELLIHALRKLPQATLPDINQQTTGARALDTGPLHRYGTNDCLERPRIESPIAANLAHGAPQALDTVKERT
jgi:hypothetical protein